MTYTINQHNKTLHKRNNKNKIKITIKIILYIIKVKHKFLIQKIILKITQKTKIYINKY